MPYRCSVCHRIISLTTEDLKNGYKLSSITRAETVESAIFKMCSDCHSQLKSSLEELPISKSQIKLKVGDKIKWYFKERGYFYGRTLKGQILSFFYTTTGGKKKELVAKIKITSKNYPFQRKTTCISLRRLYK